MPYLSNLRSVLNGNIDFKSLDSSSSVTLGQHTIIYSTLELSETRCHILLVHLGKPRLTYPVLIVLVNEGELGTSNWYQE